MKTNIEDKVTDCFKGIFNSLPQVVITAPGRINLIGEHTDYSDGFVLPVAINRYVSIAMSPNYSSSIDIYSIDFDERVTIDLEKFNEKLSGWPSYIQGVAWSISKAHGGLKGWKGVISGNIPIGAGLSSSAAVEIAAANALSMTNQLTLSETELAKLGRKAEVEWVGVNVGIMDQLISAVGKDGAAMKLDCRTLDFEYIPIPPNIRFVVLDTMTRRELTQSAYNRRHEEVILAASLLGVPSLRDASLSILNERQSALPPLIYKRAKHVITENNRVHSFCDAMLKNDLARMGKLINQSHTSLKDDFEVSSLELNLIVELAQGSDLCLGARMMGAGFGGCALAMLKGDNTEEFIRDIESIYRESTGKVPQIYWVKSTNGVTSTTLTI
jgi:galactokinase